MSSVLRERDVNILCNVKELLTIFGGCQWEESESNDTGCDSDVV